MHGLTRGFMAVACTACTIALGWSARAAAQSEYPVYTDDSTLAADTFERLPGLVQAENMSEAARAVHQAIEQEGDRLVLDPALEDVWTSVRARAHAELRARPELLERYRELFTSAAERALEGGRLRRAERVYLLTDPGYDAAVLLARRLIEQARFEAARLVIEQLQDHPSRVGERATRASEAMDLLVRYVPREELLARAERWRAVAGVSSAGDLDAVDWPPAARARVSTPTTAAGSLGLDTGALGPTPLHAVPLRPDHVLPELGEDAFFAPDGTKPAHPYVFPAIADDTVYINDGRFVSAWDRFTLRRLWRVRPPWPENISLRDTPLLGPVTTLRFNRSRTTLEDPSAAVVAGRTLIAATGLAFGGGRPGDPRVHALDRDTGRVRWSRFVSTLAPDLDYAVVRGVPMVREGTVVVSLGRFVQGRRLLTTSLAGLDLDTGEPRWVRPLASAGSLPHQQSQRLSSDMTEHRGVVYRADPIGIVAAVEVETGRPQWVRQAAQAEVGRAEQNAPWAISAPVVHGDALIVITPDRRDVLVLDLHTGAERARVPASTLDSPRFLVRVGDHLAGVSDARVAFVRLDRLGVDAPLRGPPLRERGITARPVVIGDRLAVPNAGGMLLYDPEDPAEPVRVPLQAQGNPTVHDGQLVVVDVDRMHSYLAWEQASTTLRRRLDEDPNDHEPALTLTVLAARAGEHDQIQWAVDELLERLPDDADARAEAFDAIARMVESSLGGWGDERARISDEELLGSLVRTLRRLAEGTEQTVAALLMSGEHAERSERPGDAVAAYQRLLDDAELAGATWHSARSAVRAELEATRRLELLIEEHGPTVYAPFDEELAAQLADRQADQPDGTAELLGRYPVSEHTAAAWLGLARSRLDASRPHAAARAARFSLRAVGLDARVGRAIDQEMLIDLGSTMLAALEDLGRPAEATRVLDRLERLGVTELPRQGRARPLDEWRAALADAPAAGPPVARLGRAVAGRTQQLDGWKLMRPVFEGMDRPDASRIVLRSGLPPRLAMFQANARADRLDTRWTYEYEGPQPALLRSGASTTLLLHPDRGSGPRLEALDTDTGSPRWSGEPLREIFGPDLPPAQGLFVRPGVPVEIDTPVDGLVNITSVLVAMDERTVVLIERSGRAAAFDTDTGELLWSIASELTRVHAAAADAGLLMLAGLRPMLGESGPHGPILASALVTLELRTGRLMHLTSDLRGQVRFLRTTDAGEAVVGLDSGLMSLDMLSGQTNWTAASEELRLAVDAWMFRDTLFVMGRDRSLHMGSVRSGVFKPFELETRSRLAGSSTVVARDLGTHTAFASARGIVVFDAEGRLVGLDALEGFDQLARPVITRDVAAAVEFSPEQIGDDPGSYRLYLFSVPGGRLSTDPIRLLMRSPPDREGVAALDGLLLVTAGQSTAVLRLPAE